VSSGNFLPMFRDNRAEAWNHAYAFESGHLDTPGMVTDEYGAIVGLQPAKESSPSSTSP